MSATSVLSLGEFSRNLTTSFVVNSSKQNYRLFTQEPPHELSFDRVNQSVQIVLRKIDKAIKEGKKILFVFDYDGTLTAHTNPDFSVIEMLPENIAAAMKKINDNPNLKISILSARGYDSLHHLNLDENITRYSADGIDKTRNLDNEKLLLEIRAQDLDLYNETQSLIEKIYQNNVLEQYFDNKTINLVESSGAIAITIKNSDDIDTEPLKKLIRHELQSALKGANWSELTEYKDAHNIYLASKNPNNRLNEGKAYGIRKLMEDCLEEGFNMDLVVIAGDTNRDKDMMTEVNALSGTSVFPLPLFETINIAVGDKIEQSPLITQRFSSNKDIYELILNIATSPAF